MTLTVEKCEDYVTHTLGGPIGAPVSSLELVNQCGEWFCTSHPWTFNRDRAVRLKSRAAIDLSAASYVDATKTITDTGTFASYTFLDGDIITDFDGTGITKGQVEIESRTDDDNIVLVTALGTGAEAVADLSGTLPNNTILLPSDLRHIDAIDVNNSGSSDNFSWTGQAGFAYNRTGRWSFQTIDIKGVIVNVQPSGGGAIIPMLELDPNETTAEERLYLRYTRGWRKLMTSTEVLPLPNDDSLDMLFIQALVTFARGYDKEDQGSMAGRLDQFKSSMLWRDLTGQDGSKQPELGPIQGSDVRRRGGVAFRYVDARRQS